MPCQPYSLLCVALAIKLESRLAARHRVKPGGLRQTDCAANEILLKTDSSWYLLFFTVVKCGS
jgi:hypothetical protein